MKLNKILSAVVVSIILAACSNATPIQVVDGVDNPIRTAQANSTIQGNSSTPSNPGPGSSAVAPTDSVYPAPGGSAETTTAPAYPAPGSIAEVPTDSAYPAPNQPGSSVTSFPVSGYEPQAGDASLRHDTATVDLTTSKVVVTASEPAQAKAVLNGTLPDACHSLRVVVTPADVNNTIKLDVYTLFNPNNNCTTKEDPFNASIPLGSYSSGQYAVIVNEASLGTFQTIFTAQPGDANLTRGEAALDMKASQVIPTNPQAGSASVDLLGSLPNTCHQLRIVMTNAGAEKTIKLEVYSVAENNRACDTVIQPFEVIYPLGNMTAGHYTVFVNEALLGEFDG